MAIYNEDGTCECSQCAIENGAEDIIAKQRKDIKILRTALQELVDRRERAVAQSVWGGTNDGTDGRYKRAREALDATK
jgi:hypothetical protein